jgi:hypothetical protein
VDLKSKFEGDVRRERLEREKSRAEYVAEREALLRNAPVLEEFCNPLASMNQVKEMFLSLYECRLEAGLTPWTHAYDYPLDIQETRVWVARIMFCTGGRYGADSRDIVFVPKGIDVNNRDHTTLLHFDFSKKDYMVPAYSNFF